MKFDKDFEAESDARTLMEAVAIRESNSRLKAAISKAKRMAKEETKKAERLRALSAKEKNTKSTRQTKSKAVRSQSGRGRKGKR